MSVAFRQYKLCCHRNALTKEDAFNTENVMEMLNVTTAVCMNGCITVLSAMYVPVLNKKYKQCRAFNC
jgi:hypothetical protein